MVLNKKVLISQPDKKNIRRSATSTDIFKSVDAIKYISTLIYTQKTLGAPNLSTFFLYL